MAKIHHIFINYNVLTNNFHTYQLFTSSSPCPLPIVFPILPPPFRPSPPRFLAVSVSLSSQLSLSFLLSAPPRPACCPSLSYYLLRSFLLSSPRYLASCLSLFSQLLRSVLPSLPRCPAIFATVSCQLSQSFLPHASRCHRFSIAPNV